MTAPIPILLLCNTFSKMRISRIITTSSYISFQKEIKPTPLECIFKLFYHLFSSKKHWGSQGDAFLSQVMNSYKDGEQHEERESQPGFAWARPNS